MKKIKLIKIFIVCYIVIDITHFFIFRINPVNSQVSEAYFESNEMTYIKLGLSTLYLIGLFSVKKWKYSYYLILLSSLGMIVFFFREGPLSHFLLWYSEISFWVLFLLGFYLSINTIKVLFGNTPN